MGEPDILKELREEEKLRLLKSGKNYSHNYSMNEIVKLKEIEFILNLQNGVIEEYLSKLKEGKIKANPYVILSLNELRNYYKSNDWKVLSEKISANELILSFYHLVNTYIEALKNSSKIKEFSNNKEKFKK